MAKLTEAVSAVTPLDDALREPAKRRRTPAKATPKPSVGTTFVCHCGERFEDMREAWIHVRTEYGELRQVLNEMRHPSGRRLIAACGTPSGYNRHIKSGEKPCPACREAWSARSLEYRLTHPEWVERKRKADQARRATPEYRAQRNARMAARMADPEYRERVRAEQRERHARRMADPEYRERKNAQQRQQRAKQRTDPQWREREAARHREKRARKKANP